MSDYTYQLLRVVVAQICQTIGWHSIQSTPLELLVDILHKYLQELSRETYRHTELYGRTEPNLIDIGLAFRNLNINLTDIEEYVNYVDCVACNIDVPKYPARKESNLNFLKPGSKEVLTRPVHIPEYLPPIYPEKEEETTDEIKKEPGSDGTNVDVVIAPTGESAVFKKPEITENVAKKPKIFVEEEGRPTREISSVMMTSSGFISPAREGKLPDAKAPVIPEYKSPPAPPPLAVILPQSLPVSAMDSKFDKKDKKKKSNTVAEKEQRKKEKLLKDVNKHSHPATEFPVAPPEKLKPVKKQKSRQKHREHIKDHIPDDAPLQPEVSTLRSDSLSFPLQSPPVPMNLDVKPKVDEIKLVSEPSKEKLNIFKKISTAKKEREDLSRSPNLFHDAHLLSSIPEGTTITPAPPLKHHHHLPQQNVPKIDDDQVICVDDEPGFNSDLSKSVPPPIPQNLLPPGTTIKAQAPKRPRKKAQQQQQLLDQNVPLNLSNEAASSAQHPLNMVKKDLIQIPRLVYLSQKPPKEKKERKKPKAKESKKDLLPPPPAQNTLPNQNPGPPPPFGDKSIRDSFFKDFPLSQKLGKPDSILLNNPNPYVTPNFPNVQPPIPMFPFYPFPPRPGLIPNPGLFPPLQPMPDNPAFNKFLPMMRFGTFGNMNKGPRLTSAYDEEPPPLPPIDTEKTYCNVAPLVPDSMKFQLSPKRVKSSKASTSVVTGVANDVMVPGHPGDPGPDLSKQTKICNSPIEISDDENVKSDAEDKEPELGDKPALVGNAGATNAKPEEHTMDEDESPPQAGTSDEREEKGDKRKDKLHKKGKKEKEGKIKKKKDKKDKTKNKEKAEKRKEDKKDKEKVRKLKKEKKKDKLRALAYSAEEGKAENTNLDSSQHSTVPKLTLKIGLGNSPQPDSPDGKKLNTKTHPEDMTDTFDDVKMSSFDRRESSPELARISPLVTRPPKQKTTNDNLGSVIPPTQGSVENRLPQTNFPGNSPVAASATPSTTKTSGPQKCLQFNSSGESAATFDSERHKFSDNKSEIEADKHPQSMVTAIRSNPCGTAATLPYTSGVKSASTSNSDALLGSPAANITSMSSSGARHVQYSSQTNTFLLSAVESNRPSSYIDAEGNQVWICPACGRVDDGTPMIGCDGCDAWYHWVCVGIQVPPDDNEDWYCRVCIAKKQETHGTDKKRKRKKKNKAN